MVHVPAIWDNPPTFSTTAPSPNCQCELNSVKSYGLECVVQNRNILLSALSLFGTLSLRTKRFTSVQLRGEEANAEKAHELNVIARLE